MICVAFKEHKDWLQKHPLGPVTFDGWCSICGFPATDSPLLPGTIMQGDGRKLLQVYRTAGEFRSATTQIVCSECAALLLTTSSSE